MNMHNKHVCILESETKSLKSTVKHPFVNTAFCTNRNNRIIEYSVNNYCIQISMLSTDYNNILQKRKTLCQIMDDDNT